MLTIVATSFNLLFELHNNELTKLKRYRGMRANGEIDQGSFEKTPTKSRAFPFPVCADRVGPHQMNIQKPLFGECHT
jgi:hypothetical protein